MQSEFGRADPLIDGLIADLRPVLPRRWRRESLVLAGIAFAELLLYIRLGGVRPDMPQAMGLVSFWWKCMGIGGLALLAGAAALVSLDPAASDRPWLARLWQGIGLALALMLVIGLMIEPGAREGTSLAGRLQWREGLDCMTSVAILSIPPMLALGVLMRRGASVQPARTALAAGLAAASFGAFVFAFHCPHNDALYVAAWYGGTIAVVAGLARLILPRLARW